MQNAQQLETTIPNIESIDYLSDQFSRYDQKWLVGHKGDHANSLIQLDIIDSELDLAQVFSPLGVSAKTILDAPEQVEKSYTLDIVRTINNEIGTHVAQAKKNGENVVIMMPFSNRGLERLIGNNSNFAITAPTDYNTNMHLEDKIVFGNMVDQVLVDDLADVRIPWKLLKKGDTYQKLSSAFGRENPILYLQTGMSGGGDGTFKVGNKKEFTDMMDQLGDEVDAQNLKAALGVERGYSANGNICIVPNDGGYKVFIDPISHKTMGNALIGGKSFSSVGNDWHFSYPDHIVDQYINIANTVGGYLFEKYGYVGEVGLDFLVESDENHEPQTLRMNEINPRWQGTTPYQTLNSLMNDSTPTELIHYMVKLAKSESELGEINELIGEPSDETAFSTGGFYLKMSSPKKPQVVSQDMNGPWTYNIKNNTLSKIKNESLRPTDIYQKSNISENVTLWIKAPREGQTVGGINTPCGYIAGANVPVFEQYEPKLTNIGVKMYLKVQKMMLNTRL